MTARICAVDGCDNPIPTSDNSQACPGCWNRLDRDLGQMTWLVDELNVTITRQAVIGLRNGPRSMEKPLPYNVAASDALELLQRTLWPWVREGMESHPDIWFDVTPGVVGLSRAMLRLSGWLRGHTDGHKAIEEIAYAVKVATKAIDRPADLVFLGPCRSEINGQRCLDELWATPGREIVRCHTCGAEWDVKPRQTWLLERSRDVLMTVAEACGMIAVHGGRNLNQSTVSRWKDRGLVVPHTHAPERYRLGDLLDQATRLDKP